MGQFSPLRLQMTTYAPAHWPVGPSALLAAGGLRAQRNPGLDSARFPSKIAGVHGFRS